VPPLISNNSFLEKSHTASWHAPCFVSWLIKSETSKVILKRCTKSSSNLRFYEETMCCRLDSAPEPISPGATHRSSPCCIATHRSRVVDPVPQRLWFTGRLS